MKEIVAMLRPERWQATREALRAEGVEETFQQRVLGRGRQRGLRYLRPATGGKETGMEFLPKRMGVWLVPDDQTDIVISIIVQANAGGNYGDGKIFVCPMGDDIDITLPR